MARNWIDRGLRHALEREEEQRRSAARRLHHTAVIKEKGPDLMRRLVAEVLASVDEYNRTAGRGSDEIDFQALPREGFCVTRARQPSVRLECHTDYETHLVYCNRTQTDSHESDPQEIVFNLDITVDDSNDLKLRHNTRAFQTVDDVVEFLLTPVLFPLLDQSV
jgi:hypothetical protein